jgi:nucleotide-binding universal stress UspA family protein
MATRRTIRSLLAAVDLAETTPLVLRTADALAQATGAQLHLVHALELNFPGVPDPPNFQGLFERAKRKLSDQVARELRAVEPVSQQVVLYERHRTIADRAHQVKADLIVIGPHQHRAGLLGTTADRLLRTARCPSWIARRPIRLPLSKIVIATDLSAAGHAALDAAALIVRPLAREHPLAEVVLLHVIGTPAGSPVTRESRRMLEDQAAGWIARNDLAERVRVRTVMKQSAHAARGILQYLRARPPDLFVLGTHGRGALDRLLLGGVTTRVLRETPCNALVAPPGRIPARP